MYTPITLDKMRNFRYGMKALSLIEKKFGKRIGEVDFNELTLEELSIVLWAGLVHEDATLTPDGVMDLVDQHSGLTAISAVMSDAMADAFGAPSASEADTDGKK
jgi:hypothetical protein